MNTLVYVILGILFTLIGFPVALIATKFVRKQIVGLFVLYKQTTNDMQEEWFYDQPAVALDGLRVEWQWLAFPRFYWNQEKDSTPCLKKFGEAWRKSTRRWWSPMRLVNALKVALRDLRNAVEYVTQKNLIPGNSNQGYVFDGSHILVRRSALGCLFGTVASMLVLIAAIVFVLLIVQSTISKAYVTATPTAMVFRTAEVLSTRTREQATASAQPTATPVASNTPVPLVTLPGQTNLTALPSPTLSPTAPTAPTNSNSPIGGLLLILFGVVIGAVGASMYWMNQKNKQQ